MTTQSESGQARFRSFSGSSFKVDIQVETAEVLNFASAV